MGADEQRIVEIGAAMLLYDNACDNGGSFCQRARQLRREIKTTAVRDEQILLRKIKELERERSPRTLTLDGYNLERLMLVSEAVSKLGITAEEFMAKTDGFVAGINLAMNGTRSYKLEQSLGGRWIITELLTPTTEEIEKAFDDALAYANDHASASRSDNRENEP